MKTLTIIKAIGAGVVALYSAVESAKYANEGAEAESRQASNEWRYAVTDLVQALEELQAKPEGERGPLKLRQGATDLNYGGDAS